MNAISILPCSHERLHPYIDIKFFMRVIVVRRCDVEDI